MEILVEETEEVYEILGILWEKSAAKLSRMCQKAVKDGKRENDRDFDELEGLKGEENKGIECKERKYMSTLTDGSFCDT